MTRDQHMVAGPALTRRELLRRAAGACAAAGAGALVLPGCSGKPPEPPSVNVGILHSQTGTMAISEISLRDAELLAIDEINLAGGVLGHRLEPVVEDGRSHFTDLFPKKARKLLQDDQVVVLFGCWTSSSRKAVLPVVEQFGGLLFYPVQYEGAECSPNIVYTGLVPNQQMEPAIDWLRSPAGGSRTRFYLLGTDYVFPRTANRFITRYLETKGLSPVGEQYTPFDHDQYQGVIEDMLRANPDVVLSTINGESNVAFYNELSKQGVTADRLPVMAFSVAEDELRSLLPVTVTGHLAAWGYFQSLDTPENHAFVARFQEEYGPDRVLDDPIEAAYSAVWLWKIAVEKAQSFAAEAVRHALRTGIEFSAPRGLIRVDPRNQHIYQRCRVGRIRQDRQFDIVYQSPEWIAPEPYPSIAFPDQHCDWTAPAGA